MNKVVVITGGSNGIGKELVRRFKEEGYLTVVIDKVESNFCCDYFYLGDLTSQEVLVDFSNKVIKKYGKIDCLINNACYMNGGIFDCDYSGFLEVLQVGLLAPYFLSKVFLNNFSVNASIINISSTRALQSQENTESYSAAKGGINALTRSLAVSLKGKVRVNAIAPGWIVTNDYQPTENDNLQHLVNRVGKVEDISELAIFLASTKSSFITGEVITVDGGISKLMIYHDDKGWSYKE